MLSFGKFKPDKENSESKESEATNETTNETDDSASNSSSEKLTMNGFLDFFNQVH